MVSLTGFAESAPIQVSVKDFVSESDNPFVCSGHSPGEDPEDVMRMTELTRGTPQHTFALRKAGAS